MNNAYIHREREERGGEERERERAKGNKRSTSPGTTTLPLATT